MSKNELRSSGKHRRCDFANGAGELSQCTGEWYETGGIEPFWKNRKMEAV